MGLNLLYDAQLESCLIHLNRSAFGQPKYFKFDLGRPVLGVEAPEHIVPLQPGLLHLLLGRNGSGKSLLLKSIVGGAMKDALLDTSLLVALPSAAAVAEWRGSFYAFHAKLKSLTEEDLSSLGPKPLRDFFQRPIVTALEDSLAGSNPDDFLNHLEMSAVDTVTFFGCTIDDIAAWRARCGYREVLSNFLEDDPDNFGLDKMLCEYLTTGTTVLPHNPSDQWLWDFHIPPGARWWNDPSLRDLVVPATREFLRSVTHAELSGIRSARLLAPFPEAGPLRKFLDEQMAQSATYQENSYRPEHLPFPIGLFQPFLIGGRPYVASFELRVLRDSLFELFDLSPTPDRDVLADTFEQVTHSLVRITAVADDQELSMRISGVPQLTTLLKAVSNRLARCAIGVSEIRFQWPPGGEALWGESRPKDGPQAWTPWTRTATRALLPLLELRDAVSGEWLGIESASKGQREVMTLLLQLARLTQERSPELRGLPAGRHAILVSDEFDSSLHPSASTAVLEQLTEILDRLAGVSILISTHNVAALGRPLLRGVSRIFAERTHDDFRYVTSLDSSLEVTSEILGSSFLDALKLKRLHILVEGNHDELIVRDLLSNQIPEIRDLDIVNGHGLYGWSGIVANSLRFLDSPILLVHDKRDGELEEQWRKLQNSYIRTGRLPTWGDTPLSTMLWNIRSRRSNNRSIKSDGELEKLLLLLRNNVFDRDQNLAPRIYIFGLECDDIIDLLPISSFPKAVRFGNWATAHTDFEQKRPHSRGEAFKQEFGITDRTIQNAVAQNKDTVHAELSRLVSSVRHLLDHGRLP